MSGSELIFATHNPHKLREIQLLLPDRFQVQSLADIGFDEDIAETEETIEGNSHLKSKAIFSKFGKACFADDSGLEVDALDGAPGVYSARYAGPAKDDRANWQKLLIEMRTIPVNQRGAQFKAVITLIRGEADVRQFTGIIRGKIIEEPKGNGGFGYDPVFIPEGDHRTFAEMSEEEKNKISHRAIAVQKLVEYLSSNE